MVEREALVPVEVHDHGPGLVPGPVGRLGAHGVGHRLPVRLLQAPAGLEAGDDPNGETAVGDEPAAPQPGPAPDREADGDRGDQRHERGDHVAADEDVGPDQRGGDREEDGPATEARGGGGGPALRVVAGSRQQADGQGHEKRRRHHSRGGPGGLGPTSALMATSARRSE